MSSIPFCEPCQRENNTAEAVSWCCDCVESLCQNCNNAHRINKITLAHTLKKIEDMPPEISPSLTSQKYCPLHSDLILDLYCAYHNALCCRSCMTEKHRGCDRMQSIDTVAKGIKQSPLLQTVTKDMDEDIQLLNKLAQNRTENLKRLDKQKDEITKSIAEIKQNIIDRLEALEHALLSELSSVHLLKSSNIEKQEDKVSGLIEKVNEHKKELDFVKEFGSNSQVFITLHNLKTSTTEERKQIKVLIHSLKDINIVYIHPKNQESYLTTLGILTTKLDPCSQLSSDQKTKKDNYTLPMINSRPTTQINKRPEIRSPSKTEAETGPLSGRFSKASNISTKTRYSKSSVDGCKSS
ncbi:transcription intermediary factor 1-alpha-like [Mytilus californianus]|uniref:transcription intermediary factor 1-alpha-like n=1 Tax=Mytilus californianus TaxID=6549 RepID=UPI00224718CB|nr:transcription intermediary factor 1-alpha-like [Mytilus californianus]